MNQLDIFSASGSPSPQQSSDDTGQKPSSSVTSKTLLPTPTALDGKDRDYYSKGDLAMGGMVKSLSSQVVSPASLSLPQDEEEARQTIAISGQKCLKLYETSNPTGSLQKMLKVLLTGQTAWYSSKCALTWRAKVTKSNRLLFQLLPSTHRTVETESGLLATPNTMDSLPPKSEKAVMKEATVSRPGRKNFANLRDQVHHGKMLPTPDANDGNRGAAKVYNPKSRSQSERTMSTLIGHGTGKKLRLQPAMTQWMMGFPEKWTEFPTLDPNGEKPA